MTVFGRGNSLPVFPDGLDPLEAVRAQAFDAFIASQSVRRQLEAAENVVSSVRCAAPAMVFEEVGHDFAVGDLLYSNGGTWTKALADAAGTVAVGMVGKVYGTEFALVASGFVLWESHGLTVGTQYFLSDSTAGTATTTAPTTPSFRQPVYVPVSASVVLVNVQGAQIL